MSRDYGSHHLALARGDLAAGLIRSELRIDGPVSAFDVAARLGLRVVRDHDLDVRGMTSTEASLVLVREECCEPRVEFACAHEIGHHAVDCRDLSPIDVERACDRFAAALLLPREEFAADVQARRFDVPSLARTWRAASREMIARRIGEVMRGAQSAAWVVQSPRWHTAGAAAPSDHEFEALSTAYVKSRGWSEIRRGRSVVWAWRTQATPTLRGITVAVTAAE